VVAALGGCCRRGCFLCGNIGFRRIFALFSAYPFYFRDAFFFIFSAVVFCFFWIARTPLNSTGKESKRLLITFLREAILIPKNDHFNPKNRKNIKHFTPVAYLFTLSFSTANGGTGKYFLCDCGGDEVQTPPELR
jgi:hypothetical protein